MSESVVQTEENNDEVTYLKHEIEREELSVKQLEKELEDAENEIKMLNHNLKEQNLKKLNILNATKDLQEKIVKDGDKHIAERLILLLKALKETENNELDSSSYCKQNHSKLQAVVVQLEKKVSTYKENNSSSDDLGHSSCDPLEKLNTAKIELAAKLREVLSLKRRLDEMPCQSELIQYERRFSELDVQIQEKFRQTRKCYATYNALLEIKELVLKETSLLNSITSQFQEAITSPAGRIKLIDSMEGIVKGTQQKLEKVQLGLQNEQTLCDALKEKYSRSIAEQRRYSSLLKALQEERAKNEKLRRQTST